MMPKLVDRENERVIRYLYNAIASRTGFDNVKSNLTGDSILNDLMAKPSSSKSFYKCFEGISRSFPDYELKIESVLARGDKVMVRYTICGTHTGYFMGMSPSDKMTEISGIDFFHLHEGKIIYYWNSTYQMNILSPVN